MALTIGNWIFVFILFIFGIITTIYCFYNDLPGWAITAIIITILVCGITILGFTWWHTHTAEGARSYKDYESNINNGLNREITIIAEDGRQIFHYEGKVDIETKHDGNANYILFESEENQRYIIYYGIQDTVLIIEKPD